jgi:phosphoribosylformylglycinamidine synthase subunit PurL
VKEAARRSDRATNDPEPNRETVTDIADRPTPESSDLPEPRPGDPEITPELVAEHGLSESEYERIVRILGRTPTFTELGIFSAMWSEHCGYKNSKRLLKLLPTSAPWVIQGPGENAGVIDVGDGLAIAFKIESHNHPSAVEPYQGAATGVGGILRDIFTMGARPVAVLDSLRFGDLDSGRNRYLFSGVVRGIGDYGNCVGIPNIGGEVFFDRAYHANPLVNAMAIGVMRREDLIRGEASGPGNTLMAVGARTGRDGIHGATFASEELSEDSDEASRPQVQVGDPFTEKLLLEASLELIRSGHIVGIQDMGAAGLTSSASEMAGRAGSGVTLEMADVPVREPGMTPYEILLSESQERMLVVARRGEEDAVRAILEKWELEAAPVGEVTDDGHFRILEKGRVVANVPALPLTDGCPTYEREGVEAEEVRELRERDLSAVLRPEGDLSDRFVDLLGSPNVASKRWVYEQYDTTVRTSTVVRPGGDAGVIRLRGTRRGIAATTDCNGRYCFLDPREGAKAAVAEAARNLVCVGALPTAVTNNLNFGNPLKSHIYFQMREAVLGMAEACRLFETPVTGGNVSLYNETDGVAIHPTPVIGMVGILDDVDRVLGHAFRSEGDAILLLGETREEIGASEYLYRTEGVVAGRPPVVDLLGERRLQHAMLALVQADLLLSAHDCAEGGLACALAEAAVGGEGPPYGVEAELHDRIAPVALFFGESTGRVAISCAWDDVDQVLGMVRKHGVPGRLVGRVGPPGGDFRIDAPRGSIRVPVETIYERYFNAIPELMAGGPEALKGDVHAAD